MPVIYVCRCGAELGLRFDDIRSQDSQRVEGYGRSLDDVFDYLRGGGNPSHDVVDLRGETLVEGDCQSAFERSGECNLCGECCKYVFQSISDEEATDTDHHRWLTLRGGRIDRLGHGSWDVLLHPCQSLLEESPDRFVCGCYEDRPEICRRWPEHPWDVEPYPQCGFKFSRKTSKQTTQR